MVLHALIVVRRCPTCADDMRLWVVRRGPPFKCHLGDNCSGGLFGKEIDNDGDNRFVCFRSVHQSSVY